MMVKTTALRQCKSPRALTLRGGRLEFHDMNRALQVFASVALAVLASGLTGFAAATYKGPELTTLPDAVQRAIKGQLHGAKLACVEESLDNGESLFTIEVKQQGNERSFVVAEDGSLSRVQVALEETPVEVQCAIRTQVGKGSLVQIDKFPGEDEVTYDVEITKDGKDRAFSVAEDGTLLSLEVFLDETPSSVRKAIQARLGSGRLGDIYKIFEDGEVSYQVNRSLHRRSLPFTLDAQGKLISAAVQIQDTPRSVQTTIRGKLGNAYLDDIQLCVEKGKTTYEVTFTAADQSDSFEVSEDGKLLDSDAPAHGGPTMSL